MRSPCRPPTEFTRRSRDPQARGPAEKSPESVRGPDRCFREPGDGPGERPGRTTPTKRGRAMRVAYFTMDEVNQYLVRQWAKGAGVGVGCPAGGRLGGTCPESDAVILDLDSLPTELRAHWLHRVLAGAAGGPVLAHGHNIMDSEAAALRQRGVRVCRGRVRKADVRAWLDSVAVHPGKG